MGTKPKRFLSYSEADRERYDVARKLGVPRGRGCKWIDGRHAEWFFAPTSLDIGDPLEIEIRRAIEESTEFHIFWSPNAARSAWVDKEVRWALDRVDALRRAHSSSSMTASHPRASTEPRYFFVHLLADDDAGSHLKALHRRLGVEYLAGDYRARTAWPTKSANFLGWSGVFLAGAVLVAAVSPGPLAHMVFYLILTVLGVAVACRLLWLRRPARFLVVLHLAVLGLLDFLAWCFLKPFPHLPGLAWIDGAAYLAMAGCMVAALFSAHEYVSARLNRTIRPIPLSASLAALYAALVCLYWIIVARQPRESDVRLAIEDGWHPDAKTAESLVDSLPLLPEIAGSDTATASIVVTLYATMGLAAVLLALAHLCGERSPDHEVRGWTSAAWVSAIAPAAYIALGPLWNGSLLWQGHSPVWRWLALGGYVLGSTGFAWWMLHHRSQGLLPRKTDCRPAVP